MSKKTSATQPSHYKHGDTYEVIKVLEAWELDKCFYLGNVVKYVARAGKKDPAKEIEDLEKAKSYIEMKIKKVEEMSKSHLTMSELEVCGFKVVKSYEHDDFMTQRRRNRCITIKTTWKKTGEFESQEFQIDDGEWRNLNPKHFSLLCLIF